MTQEPAGVAAAGGTAAQEQATAAHEQAVSTHEQAPPEAQPTAEQQAPAPDAPPAGAEPEDKQHPGFVARGRMRRRLRFLRKARELGYRDLGGLVFEMQRMGERHDELVATKLATLGAIDGELRTLEAALADRRPVTVLREAGIAACPRCAAIHGSEDRFCPGCGLAMDRHADRPIGLASAAPTIPGAPEPAPQTPAWPAPPIPAAPASSIPAPTPAKPAVPAPTPAERAVSAPAPTATPAPTPTPTATPTPATAPTQPASDDRPTEIIRPGERGA
ncbi:MAG TPA: hypothetical protein VMS02_07670 [Solirubrobacteraceae bacterium]|nr:hypothetical protein [Solirubrobacteraceae bacterium]